MRFDRLDRNDNLILSEADWGYSPGLTRVQPSGQKFIGCYAQQY